MRNFQKCQASGFEINIMSACQPCLASFRSEQVSVYNLTRGVQNYGIKLAKILLMNLLMLGQTIIDCVTYTCRVLAHWLKRLGGQNKVPRVYFSKVSS